MLLKKKEKKGQQWNQGIPQDKQQYKHKLKNSMGYSKRTERDVQGIWAFLKKQEKSQRIFFKWYDVVWKIHICTHTYMILGFFSDSPSARVWPGSLGIWKYINNTFHQHHLWHKEDSLGSISEMELQILKVLLEGKILVKIKGEGIGLGKWEALDNYAELRKLC